MFKREEAVHTETLEFKKKTHLLIRNETRIPKSSGLAATSVSLDWINKITRMVKILSRGNYKYESICYTRTRRPVVNTWRVFSASSPARHGFLNIAYLSSVILGELITFFIANSPC